MDPRSHLLSADGVANLFFGLALLAFPRALFDTLGLPWPGRGLYPTILGGVLIGIGIALLLESRGRRGPVGLGLRGAVAINLVAAGAIAAWLVLAAPGAVPARGRVVLWFLVLFLVGLSAIEISAHRRRP